MATVNSFGSRASLKVDGRQYSMFRLDTLRGIQGNTVDRLPFSLKILLENLLRNEDDAFVKRADRFLSTLLYDGKAVDPMVFGAMSVMMLGIGISHPAHGRDPSAMLMHGARAS